MKIAIINKHKEDTLGGSEIQCDIIARRLSERRHTIHYLAMGGKGHYNTAYKVTPVAREAEAIVAAIKTVKPDIIYWRYNKHQFFPAIREIHSLEIPFVFAVSHINDIKKWDAKAVSKNKLLLKRFIISGLRVVENRSQYRGFRYVDGVIVNNSEFLNRLDVHNQVCIRSFVENVKKSFPWNRPYVVWVSSLKPSKRPELCLDVAKKLQNSGVDVLMIGPVQKDSYLYFNDKEQLPDNLFYLGVKTPEEVNGAIESSLCLIHTGEPEGFPNTFMQAWMLGKSVVSLEYDPDQLLKNEQIGFCSDGNAEKFTETLLSVINASDERGEIEQRASQFAEKHFSPERNVELLETFLEDIVRKKRGKS